MLISSFLCLQSFPQIIKQIQYISLLAVWNLSTYQGHPRGGLCFLIGWISLTIQVSLYRAIDREKNYPKIVFFPKFPAPILVSNPRVTQ